MGGVGKKEKTSMRRNIIGDGNTEICSRKYSFKYFNTLSKCENMNNNTSQMIFVHYTERLQ